MSDFVVRLQPNAIPAQVAHVWEDFSYPSQHACNIGPASASDDHNSQSLPEVEDDANEPYQVGFAAGLAAARQEAATVNRAILEAVTNQCKSINLKIDVASEKNAAALAELIINILYQAIPSLQILHGECDIKTLIQLIVPRLHTEKAVSIKVHPSMAATVRQKLYQVLSDKQSNFDLKECAGLSAGDIQMDWQDGRAIRDTTQLHTDIMQILHKFGISGAACRIDG